MEESSKGRYFLRKIHHCKKMYRAAAWLIQQNYCLGLGAHTEKERERELETWEPKSERVSSLIPRPQNNRQLSITEHSQYNRLERKREKKEQRIYCLSSHEFAFLSPIVRI